MKTRLLILIILTLAAAAHAADIKVYAAAEKEVYINKPFKYQVVIDGQTDPGTVDTTNIDSFNPRYIGGQPQSSSSTTIINGRTTTEVISRYYMIYELIAHETGSVTIPAVMVDVNGRKYNTNDVEVYVQQPGSTDKIDLEILISDKSCYVGQPVTIAISWLITPDIVNRIGDFSFYVPALDDTQHFIAEELEPPDNLQTLTVQVNGQEATAVQAQRKDGRIAVSFRKILIPRKSGTVELGKAQVNCQIDVSKGGGRGRDPFDSFFNRTQREYQQFTAEANGATLEVRALPVEGKPLDFQGLVGRYEIEASASPTEVSVGDPITLTITVRGKLLRAVEMPDLGFMAEDFRIPSEQAPPRSENGIKVFTQTIRAEKDTVTEIPGIPLSFFDVDKGEYRTVYSGSIPLTVSSTRKVTSDDAIGYDAPRAVSQLQSVEQGIAANYEGPKLLENKAFSVLSALSKPGYLSMWLAGPMVLGISGLIRMKGRVNPTKVAARIRATACKKAISKLGASSDSTQIGEVLRVFVGERFDRTGQALTSGDCREILQEAGRADELCDKCRHILELCEMSQFAGAGIDSQVNVDEVMELIRKIDREGK